MTSKVSRKKLLKQHIPKLYYFLVNIFFSSTFQERNFWNSLKAYSKFCCSLKKIFFQTQFTNEICKTYFKSQLTDFLLKDERNRLRKYRKHSSDEFCLNVCLIPLLYPLESSSLDKSSEPFSPTSKTLHCFVFRVLD